MEKSFHINIITPERKLFEGEVISLIVPAALGYLGILANHAPLIAGIGAGKIIYGDRQGARSVIDNKNQGFMEVLNNKVSILLEGAY